MGKTTYCSYWGEEFYWISKCKSDQYSAFCKACNKPFIISGSGIGHIKSYHRNKKHLELLDKLQNGKQRIFTNGKNGQMILTKLKWSLTEKEKILNADILQVLHVGQATYLFQEPQMMQPCFSKCFQIHQLQLTTPNLIQRVLYLEIRCSRSFEETAYIWHEVCSIHFQV